MNIMKAIAVSDIHLGWGIEEGEAFRDFLDEIPDWNLDYLVLIGDIFELWRRDLVGAVLENSDIVSKLIALNKETEVILIAGNHDWHFMEMGHPEDYPAPFKFKDYFTIRMDGFFYSFQHGHHYDPLCKNDRQNKRMCHSNDEQGDMMSEIWDTMGGASFQTFSRPLKSGVDPSRPYIPIHMISLLAYVERPGVPSRVPSVLEIVRENAKRDRRANEYLVHGHTHVAHIEDMYCDTGCWVEGYTDYLLIEDDVVSLEVY